MALPGAAVLAASILALPPAVDPVTGSLAFASKISSYLSLMQAGPTGSPGILVFNSAIFGALIATMPPDPTGLLWGPLMASNWLSALLASVIVPATVVSPVWTASVVDVLTLPTAAASIPTASVAMATLSSGLSSVKADATAPKPLADAFQAAFLQMQFLCIGLTFVGPVPTPTPLPFGAL